MIRRPPRSTLFPTRRSSDLFTRNGGTEFDGYSRLDDRDLQSYWKSNPYLTKEFTGEDDSLHPQWVDRKSTRLNSSHGYISYAVFCLKKKKKHTYTATKKYQP